MTNEYSEMFEWFNNLGEEWNHHIDWFWSNWCREGGLDKDEEFSDEFISLYKAKYGNLSGPPQHEEEWG